MASNEHLHLDQVSWSLPRVPTDVINDAQRAIDELKWDGEFDDSANDIDDCFEEVYAPSTPAYSLPNSRCGNRSSYCDSFTGSRAGGLSPPRIQRRNRPDSFSNFDGQHQEVHHPMDEGSVVGEVDGLKKTSGKPREASLSAQDIDMTELSRQLAGYDPQTIRRIANSGVVPNQGVTEASEDHNEIKIPVRRSSKGSRENGISHSHDASSSGNDTVNGADANKRARFPIIIEDEDDSCNLGDKIDQELLHSSAADYQALSHLQPARFSSTPPPIRNPRSAHTRRILLYDKSEDKDDNGASISDDSDEPEPRTNSRRRHHRRAGPACDYDYDDPSKPLISSRTHTNGDDRQSRPQGLSSDSIRLLRHGSRTTARATNRAVRGSSMSGVHWPHASGITSKPRSRTPRLHSLQLYVDAQQGGYRSVEQQAAAASTGPHSAGAGTVSSSGAGSTDWPRRSMSRRRTYSDDEVVSMRQMLSSGRSAASVQSASVPEFFSSSVFNVVLHDPTTAHQLLKFSEKRLCAENVEFLSKVDEYRTTLNTLASQMAGIHRTFISPGSPSQINVNGHVLRRTHKEMKTLINEAFPAMDRVFTDMHAHVETVVFQDIYPSFVRHQMALSATKALGSDRLKYHGLGDCFTLTDPNTADNPILFASDGFVKVTGYRRAEIIPRNCRFLQGAHTDREPVQRLKQAVAARKESVELLLNYKKNGEPFWNLLYVAPLYDSTGQIRFFIGGQVNCSTTIHNHVDVMKVLSLSKKDDDKENESLRPPSKKPPPTKPSARRALLKVFGVRLDDQPMLPQIGDGGMEEGVLNRMGGQDPSSQMKEFYTAYSKYLVVRATTWNIEFFSAGIVETLNPANLAAGMVAGSEVFRFLSQHMLSKQTEYKTRVRNAIRAGFSTSTRLRLQTRRAAMFRGDESFLAHWTPLKDAKANVQWVVVTIALTSL